MNKDKTYSYEEYDKNNKLIYFENSKGGWFKKEFNKNDNEIYYESSYGNWCKYEYDNNGILIHYGDSNGYVRIGNLNNGIEINIR